MNIFCSSQVAAAVPVPSQRGQKFYRRHEESSQHEETSGSAADPSPEEKAQLRQTPVIMSYTYQQRSPSQGAAEDDFPRPADTAFPEMKAMTSRQ